MLLWQVCISMQAFTLRSQVDSTSATWFSSDSERQVSQRLAEAAAAGLQMLPQQLGQNQLSWQIIRGAAVAPAAATSAQQNGSPENADSPAASSTAGVSQSCWASNQGLHAIYIVVWCKQAHSAPAACTDRGNMKDGCLQGCQGYAPAYDGAQQKQLRGVLSAVRAVFTEASDPILDRTTGAGG
jgi:hypothetical protein